MVKTKERRIWTGSSMPMCKLAQMGSNPTVRLANNDLISNYSDSHNPENAAKQIMAIAPIIPGQKETSQFQIPPHKSPSQPTAESQSGSHGKDSAFPNSNSGIRSD